MTKRSKEEKELVAYLHDNTLNSEIKGEILWDMNKVGIIQIVKDKFFYFCRNVFGKKFFERFGDYLKENGIYYNEVGGKFIYLDSNISVMCIDACVYARGEAKVELQGKFYAHVTCKAHADVFGNGYIHFSDESTGKVYSKCMIITDGNAKVEIFDDAQVQINYTGMDELRKIEIKRSIVGND